MKKLTTHEFSLVLSIFEKNNPEPYESNLVSLIYSSINKLIESKKDHEHGMDWYVESKFEFLKENLPATATVEEFKTLFHLSYLAKNFLKNKKAIHKKEVPKDLYYDALSRQLREIGMGIYDSE